MKTKKKKFSIFNLDRRKLVYIAVAVVLAFSVVAIAKSRAEINDKKAQLEALQMQCAQQQMEIDNLYDLINRNDREYIERKAREELDYVLPGERVYIVRGGSN